MNMEIKDLISPLLRWWWLLLVATLIAGVTSFIVARREPPVYRASTTLMIGRAISAPNPSGGEFQTGQQLADIYADIAERDPVALATKEALGIEWLPDYNARALPNSQFLEITVVDIDPELAAIVANEMAHQLILQSPTAPGQEDQARQEFVTGQLNYLETKIQETQDEIIAKQTELAEIVSARQIADTQTAIAALQDKLTTLQANYASLLGNTQAGATNTLNVIDFASVPSVPFAPDVPMITLLSAAVGFSLAAAGAYLIEYLDDTIRTQEDVARVTDLPVIGFIPDAKELKLHGGNTKLLARMPDSRSAEAFRTLRTNLEFAGTQGPPRTILVASPNAGQGAVTVATQLAASFALTGKRVALIDANLRDPRLHEFLEIKNELGLADMLEEDLVPQVVATDSGDWHLKVITAGKPTERAPELLSHLSLLTALTRLREQAQVCIFIGPPLVLAESMLLASRMEGALLVLRSGHTREQLGAAVMVQLRRAGANVVGIVLNGLRTTRSIPSTIGYLSRLRPRTASNGSESEQEPTLQELMRSRGEQAVPRPETPEPRTPAFKGEWSAPEASD